MRRTGLLFSCLILCPALLLVAAEKKIKKSDLPAAVQKAADEQSKGATVRGYSQETERGKTLYEVELRVNNHGKDVTINADGRVVEVEEEIPFDSLSEAVRQGLTQQAKGGKIGKIEALTKNNKLVAYEAHVLKAGKRPEIQVDPDGRPLDHKE